MEDWDKLLRAPRFRHKLKDPRTWVAPLVSLRLGAEFQERFEEAVEEYLRALEGLDVEEVALAVALCLKIRFYPPPELLRRIAWGLGKIAPAIAMSLVEDTGDFQLEGRYGQDVLRSVMLRYQASYPF